MIMRFRTSTARCSLALAGIAGLACLAGGCGYSGREEYMRIRAMAVEPVPGDGSTIASLDSVPAQIRAGRAAVIATGQPRGLVSDQSQQ